MSTIDNIRERLKKHPALKVRYSDNAVTIEPQAPNGFSVSLEESHGKYTVSFDGWHEEFDTAEEALDCFALGLSDQCRLRVELKGGVAYRWTLEFLVKGAWMEDSTTGSLLYPFWMQRQVIFRQNSVIIGPHDRAVTSGDF